MTGDRIHVVAGVIRDDAGRILLAQRPLGGHLAGLWEFPGGKREAGESRWDALVRELNEELGIVAQTGRPLISVPFSYADKSIRLDVWQVGAYSGTAWSREGQALQWVHDAAFDAMAMPSADRPVISALRLPSAYLITPDLSPQPQAALIEPIRIALQNGIRLVQLRLPQWSSSAIASVAVPLHALARQYGARLLLHADIALATASNFDGVHLPARVAARCNARPLPRHVWLGVSCHDSSELAHAARIGADFATLSPVSTTASHPDQVALGWQQFADVVADARIPVYALGGMTIADIEQANNSGAQGIAGIRALWVNYPGESQLQCRASAR